MKLTKAYFECFLKRNIAVFEQNSNTKSRFGIIKVNKAIQKNPIPEKYGIKLFNWILWI